MPLQETEKILEEAPPEKEEGERSLPELVDSDEKPYLVIRPAAGWQIINVRELWHYRDLLITLGVRDIKLRYRQTALGAIWVIMQPLLAAGIFTFVFGKVAKMPSDGVPYFLFSYAGLLAWNAFSSCLNNGSGSLLANSQLVSKVYFPRLILPLSTLFSTLVDFCVAAGMMVVLMVTNRVTPHIGILLVPVWLLLVLMFASGISFLLTAIMVSYRDVKYAIPVLVPFLMYASPVAYSVSAVPGKMRYVFMLNPLSGLLEAFRWSLLGVGKLPLGYVEWSAACAVVAFIVGAMAFRKMERKFADVI